MSNVIPWHLIKHYLMMRNVKLYTIEISSSLILDTKSSRIKYESYLEEQKKSNKLQEKKQVKEHYKK